ncbi:3-hydroxyacyl-[acyl-carrier-protein] dehydratase FabZ [Buchnera aphidicola (Cinara cuneomaculata)]|uniref:3-hydroxyacyl-[acyl-carrier-protein] dehydratase FabZ n=1 Tax=Buchnera aphidicola (Cinara cuneomaculata) TaxID=1660040 RepID=A0A451CXP3_9GAMM|nr:3-hydroxyacyl-ACP dehydratase FabZ [Buchnera aphidicola]VFP78144.1 3-hydroxyacyl-[acyl-carrier-protein] dehydratase FabZ [Buchnera aphidicola (Cinara cuneomaculata)]
MNNIIDDQYTFSLKDILRILPHRFPFLLIDKILDFKKNIYIRALKNITVNDFFFCGHFPKKFIFPGVLIIESIAQSCGILLFYYKKNNCIKKKICCLTGIYNTRFIHPVYPGDQMIIKTCFKKQLGGIYLFKGIVTVKKLIVCQSTLSLSFL